MEDIWEEGSRKPTSIAERVNLIERKLRLEQKKGISKEKTRIFKWPFKWRTKFAKTNKKRYDEMVLVVFLNKKNQIEPPRFMPVFDGNMVIWKNKPYEFDPRAMWAVKGFKGNPQAYLIKEIDRRPVRNEYGKYVYRNAAVSNLDLDEIRARGDSTESDEFLIKAALKAQTSKGKKSINVIALVVVGLIIVGGLIYLLAS